MQSAAQHFQSYNLHWGLTLVPVQGSLQAFPHDEHSTMTGGQLRWQSYWPAVKYFFLMCADPDRWWEFS